MYNKTKKGATSLIVTMFFTLLAGILVLSFVSIMLSNINESTNYNLSQSAYDAALAGIEDAKIMLLEYNNCMARNDTTSSRCKEIVKTINAEGSDDDCDIVRKALGRAEGSNETLIRTDNSKTGTGVDSTFDMAYTCVMVSMKVPNYLGTITKDTDTKVIPIRTHSAAEAGAASGVKYIRIDWFSNDDYTTVVDNGLGGHYKTILSSSTDNAFGSNKISALGMNDKKNNFDKVATLPPVLNIGLIQSGANFKLSEFIIKNGSRTNRARITLRPVYSSSAVSGGKITPTVISDTTLANSTMAANKDYNNSNNQDDKYLAANSPIDVKCYNGATLESHPYMCSTIVQLPSSYTGAAVMDNFRFLTLSSPYPEPDISFQVTLLDGYPNGNTVDFVGVQSSVDSTGRANDLFRRIDARVELIDIGYPFPKYTVGVYCAKNDPNCTTSGNLIKNYRATYNCWKINNGRNIGCDSNFASDGIDDGGFTDKTN